MCSSRDNDVVKQAFKESGGRYRLLSSACYSLEVAAKQIKKEALTGSDVKGFALCEDAARLLRKGGH